MLIIVAVDGNDVVPFKTDIVVIKPGESVDYIIFTDRPHDITALITSQPPRVT